MVESVCVMIMRKEDGVHEVIDQDDKNHEKTPADIQLRPCSESASFKAHFLVLYSFNYFTFICIFRF